jgi:hypothetical protein
MLILFHVLIALSSIIMTGYAFFVPTKAALRISYTLVGLTLASGTFLVMMTHAPMLRSCATGLAYLAFVVTGLMIARLKLRSVSHLA